VPREIFERAPDYWFDVGHPRWVSRITFLISGLAYGLGKGAAGFVDNGMRNLLAAEAFRDLAGRRVPVPPLLRDSTQAGNSLLSFLGGDLGEKSSVLLEVEDADVLKQSSLQALAEHAVSTLAEGGDEFSAWSLLYAILGDLPSYEHLADRVRSLLQQTDFVGLFEKNLATGNFAIMTASLQAVHLRDEDLRLHLKSQLAKIAQLFARWESGEMSCQATYRNDFSESDLCTSLIESALNVSIATQPPQDAVPEFVGLLARLIETWNSMIPVCKPIVQVLSQELPIAQAQQFWPLIVRLRAE